MASYAFAPQSMLAPLGAVTLVVNLLLAPLMHGETLRWRCFYTCLIVAGIVLCISSRSGGGGGGGGGGDGGNDAEKLPIDSLDDLYALAAGQGFLLLLKLPLALLSV